MFSLSALKSYEGWSLKEESKFDSNDLAMIKSAKVVSSDFGQSILLLMDSGSRAYLACSRNGKQLNIGDIVDPRSITIETLSQRGKDDIYRGRVD